MIRILLTGATGQVGWELQRTLAPLGQLIALDRLGMDLAKPDSIRAAIREHQPQIIVNAAAYTAVDNAEADEPRATAINGVAPGIMAEEANRIGAALIHYSTDYVYNGAKMGVYVEDDATAPLNAYGRSKLAGEDAIRATGVPHLILRTAWVYGGRGKNFLLTMLRLAREREELKIVADQIGAPTWCRMIAEATSQILVRCNADNDVASALRSELGGVYHLTAAGQTSWHGFASAIVNYAATSGITGLKTKQVTPIPTTAYPLPAQRPANSALSNEKLATRFGIALPNWEASLQHCLQDTSTSPVHKNSGLRTKC